MTTYNWVDIDNNQMWSDPNDWSPAGVPGAGDTADVANNDTAVVTSSTGVGTLSIGTPLIAGSLTTGSVTVRTGGP